MALGEEMDPGSIIAQWVAKNWGTYSLTFPIPGDI